MAFADTGKMLVQLRACKGYRGVGIKVLSHRIWIGGGLPRGNGKGGEVSVKNGQVDEVTPRVSAKKPENWARI